MKLKTLIDYFMNNISCDAMTQEISEEVATYSKSRIDKGGSTQLYVDVEGCELRLKIDDIAKLCRDYLNEQINNETLQYIAEVLEQSEAVEIESKDVEDIVYVLANPEINYPLNKELVSVIEKWNEAYSDQRFLNFLEYNIKPPKA